MIIVRNKKSKVIILQAIGAPTLRLAPGDNYIDVESASDLKPYVDGNRAAKARFDTDLTLINSGEENKEEADIAKEKNDLLNKAQAALQVVKRESESKGAENEELKKQIKILMDKVKKLESKGSK
jgi:hypothetical protein